MNPFYNAMGVNNGAGQPMQGGNLVQMLGQLRQNPMQFLMQRRFNVPQNMVQNPEAIIQHLVQTGQISQEQLSMAQRKLAEMQGQIQNRNA